MSVQEDWLEIPNSVLSLMTSSFHVGEVYSLLESKGCLRDRHDKAWVEKEIRETIEHISAPNTARPTDMSGADIIAKALYLSGELSSHGKRLYETSPNGGPNKNPYSGIPTKSLSGPSS